MSLARSWFKVISWQTANSCQIRGCLKKKFVRKKLDQEELLLYHGWYHLNNSIKESHNHNQNKPLPKDIQEKQEIQRNIISSAKYWQPGYWENAVKFARINSIWILHLHVGRPKPDKHSLREAQGLQAHHGTQNSHPLAGHSSLAPAPARWRLCLHSLFTLLHLSLLP